MKILKKLFLLCIPCMMFFSCESSEQRYVLSDVISKSEARKYYEDKLHGIITANDYKNGKYMVAALDGSSPGDSLLIGYDPLEGKLIDGAVVFPYIVTKFCPVTSPSGRIYFEDKKFSFTFIDYYSGEGKESTGKYSFRMVAEKNADVKNFITEDASFTGDILTIKQEKEIFDPLVKTIVEELKEQDIFNKKSDKPESKSLTLDKVAGTEYNGAWSWCNGSYENSDYVTLQIDIPHFIHEGKSGSLYFYILQYNLFQNTDDAFSLVSVEGAFCYDGKKKFIYKDYDGKLKD